MLLSGKSIFPEGDPIAMYQYTGSKSWTEKEKKQFTRAWRVHKKKFRLLASAVSIHVCTISAKKYNSGFGQYKAD